ncbi:MAG: response regulator transcription factor [Chloroflexi bacterium]|nr:response regulator transcription factor [Chloroflexota bacterium]
MTKTRILLADDHAVLRAGLKMLLNAQSDLTVVGEAATGTEALGAVANLSPDLLLLDLTMPETDGLSVLRDVRRTYPSVRVLVLTMHEEEGYLRSALEAGAAGYCPKSAADAELISAIRAVMRGNVYIHPSHARYLLEQMLAPGGEAADALLSALSEREGEVLKLVARGHTNQDIAEQLSLSVKTVETYRARGMDKLGFKSRAALVRYALQMGWMSDE